MTIKIEYFSDVLCIWAYIGQIRMDELKHKFAADIEIENRFVPIFGAGKQQVETAWKDKGGAEGFNHHLQEVTKNWQHITVSPDLWTKVTPQSSTTAHLYLKAIQLLQKQGKVDSSAIAKFNGRTYFEEAIWQFRDAFFRQAKDISRGTVQDEIAVKLALPLTELHQFLDSGFAHAELHKDDEARHTYKVSGSPTLVLNEGRQLLYGNVGYRIIEANVSELLHNPDQGEASWC